MIRGLKKPISVSSSTTHHLRNAFLPVAIVLMALAFSCTRRSEENSGPDRSAIEIGYFGDLTGPTFNFGKSAINGVLMAASEINLRGGINGRPIDVVIEDDRGSPEEAARLTAKLIDKDKVIAIIGGGTSGNSRAAAPKAQSSHVPLISPSSTDPAVTKTGDYIFRACFVDSFQGAVMAKFARHSLKLQQVAILSSASSAQSVGLARIFRQRFADDGGQIVAEQKYSDGDKDFRAQLTAIRAAGVEGIFVPGYYAEAALICKQARDLGLAIPLFGIDGWESSELISIGGKAVEGSYFSTHFSAQSTDAAVVSFNGRFAKRWNTSSDALSALGYDSAMLLADAINRAGTTESAKLRSALAATKEFRGVTGTISLDAQRNATKSAVVLQVKDGKFVFVERVDP